MDIIQSVTSNQQATCVREEIATGVEKTNRNLINPLKDVLNYIISLKMQASYFLLLHKLLIEHRHPVTKIADAW